MKRNIVVFDLDDVIAKMRFETSRVFSKVSGKHVPIEEWDFFCSEHLYGVEFCPEMMMREKIIERCLVEEDAKYSIDLIRSLGLETAIITARGWHNEGRKVTEEWLSSHQLDVDHLHIVELDKTKYDVFSKLQYDFNILSFIDDQPKYIEQAIQHEAVRNVFVRNHPWNQNIAPQKVKRVNSLTEFAHSIKNM
jgi:uncharacterized HAD superfamily protein